ncbi:hypothetical protein T459_30423 [Capsicum annuum]|uniref:Methyltransferase n=1 Tax=Capsicum annuum TaxID=4072 RepID=A0A2G2Y8D3_CAPAN|nr:hypothetical protein T459_30423 [Capsicum annuum]
MGTNSRVSTDGKKDIVFSEKVKAYTIRVGYDPFPTEIMGKGGDLLRFVGQEFGTTTRVSPCKMASILKNSKQVLRPNGHILLRDYAVGDSA